MKKRTSIFKNKIFSIFFILNLITLIISIIYYFKIKSTINISELNVANIVKNNTLYHILESSFIFFSSYILIGFISGLIIYFYDLLALFILIIYLIINYGFSGLILAIIILLFKSIYFVLFFYLVTRSYYISKYLISKKNNSKDRLVVYSKEAIVTGLIIILLEMFNYVYGYRFFYLFKFLIK